MRIAILACATCALTLTGCMDATVMTGGTPKTATTKELCRIMHWKGNGYDYGADAAFEELKVRSDFTTRELRGIRDGLPRIGDSENAALCSQGYFYEDLNITATQYSTSKQYVFPRGLYIYVEKGRVTAIQL